MPLTRVVAKSLHTCDLLLSKADGVSLVKSLPTSEYDFLLLLSPSRSSVEHLSTIKWLCWGKVLWNFHISNIL